MRIVACVILALSSGVFAEPLVIATNPTAREFYPEVEQGVIDAFALADIDMQLIHYPSERSRALFAAGEVDGDVMRLADYGNQLENIIAIPTPVKKITMLAIVHEDSPYQTVDELLGKQMGVTIGIRIHSLISERMQAETTQVNDIERAAKMLASRRIDFTAYSPEIIETYIAEGYPIRALEVPILEMSFHTWLKSEYAGLIPTLDAAYQQTFLQQP